MLARLGLIGLIEVVAPIVPCFAVQQALTTPELDGLGLNTQDDGHLVPCEVATLAEPLIPWHEFVCQTYLTHAQPGECHTATGARVACGQDGADLSFGVLDQSCATTRSALAAANLATVSRHP